MKTQGFTLIELCISLALLVILMSVAVPSFQQYLAHKRQQTYLYTLEHTLTFAHLYSLQHQTTVYLCPSENQKTCAQDWTKGGMVFSEQTPIATFPAIAPGETLTVRLFPNANQVKFLPYGLATQSSGSFALYDPTTKTTMTLFLSNTGRIRIASS